ncbi:hypothetical protein LCGC14_1092220 [marine sediment metagenome]|uniref:Uncharacterized protein n=1 Tax=marine sediment metagenome TaxID=412755 RepID=A0A0F9MGC5_9ZZZZ
MSKFKYLDNEIGKKWNFNEFENLIQLEIANQLKRIADALGRLSE